MGCNGGKVKGAGGGEGVKTGIGMQNEKKSCCFFKIYQSIKGKEERGRKTMRFEASVCCTVSSRKAGNR